eukprot:Skav218134  [mRNA]  locus=scaffold759:371388:377624:- [translate_table: standard]
MFRCHDEDGRADDSFARTVRARGNHSRRELCFSRRSCRTFAARFGQLWLYDRGGPSADGQFGTVLLMDFHQDVASYLNPISAPVGLEGLRYFEEMDYLLVPVPGELVDRGVEWSLEGMVDERMQFYSAEEEVPETPPPAPKRSTRRRAAGGMPGDPASPAAPKTGRVTVAKLAESLEAIHAALPNITTQLQELTLRTAAIEEGGARPADRQSALRRPIGSSAMIGSAVGSSNLGALVGEMPPPRGSRAQAAQPAKTPPRVTFTKQEAEELAEDFEEGQTDLTKAMLQQSRALTALVSHMALQSGDPFLDLGATGSSSSMRMHPAQLAEVDMSVLRDRGVTPTQYLERFGGYGRVRDIGFIQWQLALAMNHLQEENWLAAKDGIALLFTMLEQTAMDNGKMDVGLLLSLQEDPPQTVFTGRSLASGSTSRPFAPTAHQRWITTALQYLKEMDVISTRRQEATKKGDQNQGDQSTGDDGLLEEVVSFQSFLASLPRWILRSRTDFAAFLSSTFHAVPSGRCPPTAVFPLPLPCHGLFGKQLDPKLSKQKWRRLCFKRALHIITMALSYAYAGMRPVPLELLGRQPNSVQNKVFRHLRACLTACDSPEDFLLPPGRSGPEFVAKLIELQKFVDEHSAFNPDTYAGSAADGPKPVEKVGAIGLDHKFKTTKEFSAINPYRSLNADRLKLSGTGSWPMEKHLDGVLWLPFLEPAILQHPDAIPQEGPSFVREQHEEYEKLLRIWDARGLLALFEEPHPSGYRNRVFNAHKNFEFDRQIGDRRWFNGAELHPQGLLSPSKALQGKRERAFCNMVPFSFSADSLRDLKAFDEMIAARPKRFKREEHGDRLAMRKLDLKKPCSPVLYGAFSSLFQGDHLGVEYALESHANMLKTGGLLQEGAEILRGKPLPKGPLYEGLVIDDYFAISCEAASTPVQQSRALENLNNAEAIYHAEGVFGSDEKTVRGEEKFKVIGAEVDATQKCRDAGIVSVGAALAKRIPMALLSLRVASLPCITRALASRLAGNWVSIFMFRRVLSSTLAGIFSLGTKSQEDADEVLALPRKAAEELVLAAIFSLVAVTDVSATYDTKIYATDASNSKGAITSKTISQDLCRSLWLGGDRRGKYTMLDNQARAMRRGLGVEVDSDEDEETFCSPSKALDFAFDAVELFGGSGVLSKALSRRGLRVCPPIDLSSSKHYNFEQPELLNWIFQMIKEKRFRLVICEPPCTTFSPAQHPASRGYDKPLGYDRKDPKTKLGNLLAFRALAILWFCWREEVLALLEQSRLSKMAWLPFWQYLLQLGFEEAITASCEFGSIHRKEFRWIGCGFPVSEMTVKCKGGHKHVKVEGKYTKASAVYHEGLADHIALHLARALRKSSCGSIKEDGYKRGFESIILNDVLLQAGWSVEGAWEWKSVCHINVLESRSFVALLMDKLLAGGGVRFVCLLDSQVAKGALAKGRSSAWSLRTSLLRAMAISVAGNLHPAYGFAPTRLNTADAPTRDKDLPEPAEHSILDFLTDRQVSQVHALQFSKAVAGWIRLFILASFCLSPGEACGLEALPPQLDFRGFAHLWTSALWLMDFVLDVLRLALDFLTVLSVLWLLWISSSRHLSWIFLWFGTVGDHHNPQNIMARCPEFSLPRFTPSVLCAAMPISRGLDEQQRASRRAGTVLQADRVVTQTTRDRRDGLLSAFDNWLAQNMRITLARLLEGSSGDPEAVSEALVAYGKDMYYSGKSYGKFSETINAVASRKPHLRRNLASAWDLAFNWVVDEPHEHHAALPHSILVALVGLALLWGWTKEAAVIALGWAGILRIGEIYAATRADLILPEDAAPGIKHALLQIKLPKTRGATYWLSVTEDAEYVRRKGRWLSTRVLEIYLQETAVATFTEKITPVAMSRISRLCKDFSRILGKAIYLKRANIPEALWPRLW